MKKSFASTLGLGLLLLSSGCKDVLVEDPKSQLVPEFLATPQGVEAGLAGAYSGNRFYYGNEEGMNMAVPGTDETMLGLSTTPGYGQYDPSQLTPSSGPITNEWNQWYRHLNIANGVVKYANSVTGIDPTRVKQVIAEAKFLRAHNYFQLVQYYGDVPLNLDFVDTPTKDITRTPAKQVYAAIVQDLKDAVANLAPVAAQPGRVTTASALHLLAKVYLTRATNASAKEADDYANAAATAKELLDNQGKYNVALETDVANVFREGNENGKEVLFNVQYNADPAFNSQQQQANFFFRMRYDVQPNMVRDLANGRPFARFRPTPYLLNVAYADKVNDTRFSKFFKTVWYVNSPGSNLPTSPPPGRLPLGDTAFWLPGREVTAAYRAAKRYKLITPSQYTNIEFPTNIKWDDTKRAAVNDASIRPFIVYRLAETYLIAAEALMYLGRQSDGIVYVNALRRRALAAGKPATTLDITASQLTLDFILDERSRELCGEQMRWHDLVRTGKLLERVTLSNPPSVTPAAANLASHPYFLLRPIPQTDIDRTVGQPSGGIQQNPGY